MAILEEVPLQALDKYTPQAKVLAAMLFG